MNFTGFRVKFLRFLRKNKYLFLIAILVWAIVFMINKLLQFSGNDLVPQTTYTPHVSVMDSSDNVPKATANKVEEKLKKYVEYCNNNELQMAYNMLSDECKKYEFHDNVAEYYSYMYTKMPTKKKYAIQNYSDFKIDNKKIYVYEIKYFDDFLATGLTNSSFYYTTEKITFYYDNNDLKMSSGNYIYHTNTECMTENQYLKIDVIEKKVNYSIETYTVRITNKSEYMAVIADGNIENEVSLDLTNELRECINDSLTLVLYPGEKSEYELVFPKFVDDGDTSNAIIFPSIRIMEQYSGTEVDKEIQEDEINNAIDKFSMQVAL